MGLGQQVSPEREQRFFRFVPYLLIVALLFVIAVDHPIIAAVGAVLTTVLFVLHLLEERRGQEVVGKLRRRYIDSGRRHRSRCFDEHANWNFTL